MAAEAVQHVSSSHITGATYDPDTQELAVKFKGGSTYAYSGVPQSTVAEFSSAPSAGKYLDSMIKGIYPYRKV